MIHPEEPDAPKGGSESCLFFKNCLGLDQSLKVCSQYHTGHSEVKKKREKETKNFFLFGEEVKQNKSTQVLMKTWPEEFCHLK